MAVWSEVSVATALQHYSTTDYSRLHSIDEADAQCGARVVSAPAPHWALSVVIRAAVKPPASGSSHTTARHHGTLLATNTKQALDNKAMLGLASPGGSEYLNQCQDYFQNLRILSERNNPPPPARRGWLTLTISGGNAQILPPNGGCGGQTGKIVSGHNRWACSCCNNDKNNFLNLKMRKIIDI